MRKKGDDRQMALAEGYFYLGQHYLVIGGQEDRRDLIFQKTRDLDICLYIEHVAAGFELQRLKNDDTAAAPPASNRAVAQ